MDVFFVLCRCFFCLLQTTGHRAVDKEEDGHKIVLWYFCYTKLQVKSFFVAQSRLLLVEGRFCVCVGLGVVCLFCFLCVFVVG